MSFNLPVRAERFFASMKRLADGKPQLGLDFDRYYACAVIGLAAKRLVDNDQAKKEIGREITRDYPTKYREQADVFAGMLVEAELSRQKIPATDSKQLEMIMLRLLKLNSESRLTTEGHRLLDAYAAGGMIILDEMLVPPASEEEFLMAFFGVLESICNKSSVPT